MQLDEIQGIFSSTPGLATVVLDAIEHHAYPVVAWRTLRDDTPRTIRDAVRVIEPLLHRDHDLLLLLTPETKAWAEARGLHHTITGHVDPSDPDLRPTGPDAPTGPMGMSTRHLEGQRLRRCTQDLGEIRAWVRDLRRLYASHPEMRAELIQGGQRLQRLYSKLTGGHRIP